MNDTFCMINLWSLKLRVRADPEIIWNVMEFKVEILQALKSLENDLRYEKVRKNTWEPCCWPGKYSLLLLHWLILHHVCYLAFISVYMSPTLNFLWSRVRYLNFVMKGAFQRILFVYMEVKISQNVWKVSFFLENVWKSHIFLHEPWRL